MKFQIYLFIFAALFAVSVADTLLRSQSVKNDAQNPEDNKRFDHLRKVIEAHRKGKKNVDPRKMTIFFDEATDEKNLAKRDTLLKTLNGPKRLAKRDTLLKNLPVKNGEASAPQREDRRAIIVFKNAIENGKRHLAKRDTLLKSLPVQREDRRTQLIIGFKNGEANEKRAHPVQREDRRKLIVFKNGENGQKQIAKRDTLLKSLPVQRQDRRIPYVAFALKNGQPTGKHIAKRDTLLKSLPTGDKRAPQHDALLNALRERYGHLKKVAKRDTLLKSLPVADKKNQKGTDRSDLAARRREAFIKFLKNRQSQKNVAQRDTLLRSDPGIPRQKRDIAATVVGAAVSSVVSNLMKNVEESVVKAENDAKKVQADLDSDQGRIIDYGVASVVQDVPQQAGGKRVPVSNEAVPRPFAPIKAHDTPKSNDIIPIHADVEVIVGNNVTSTSTVAPVADKKGFFATLFNSFKLLFGTVTNSVGGLFIDIGSRITSFVEKHIKV